MILLILGLLIFLGVHSISIINNSWRDQVAAKIGDLAWKALYSIISIVGFVLIIMGYRAGSAASIELYTASSWMWYATYVMQLPVFILLLAAYLPGRIKEYVRHPMLWATILWAVAHLLSNGEARDIVLFGSILCWAAIDLFSYRARPSRPIPGAPPAPSNDIIALALGGLLYFLFLLWIHELLIGIPILH